MSDAVPPEIRTIPVDIGGRTYSISSDDLYLEHIRAGFEPETVRLLSALAKEDFTVLDIGANIGCTALLFGALAREVHAFEPSPSTYALLQANVIASGARNILLRNLALGDSDGTSELTFSPKNRSGAFVSDAARPGGDYTVEKIGVRALDSLLLEQPIDRLDLMKIDVEGFELHVLRGANATISKFRPVVTMELNHWCLNAFQRTSIPDFFDALRARFPLLYAVDEKLGWRADLGNPEASYRVMYEHIINFRWPQIVAAFEPGQLSAFLESFRQA